MFSRASVAVRAGIAGGHDCACLRGCSLAKRSCVWVLSSPCLPCPALPCPAAAGSVDLQDCDVFPSSSHPCAFEIVTPEEHRRAGPQRDQFHYMCVCLCVCLGSQPLMLLSLDARSHWTLLVFLSPPPLCSFRAESEVVMKEWVQVLQVGEYPAPFPALGLCWP